MARVRLIIVFALALTLHLAALLHAQGAAQPPIPSTATGQALAQGQATKSFCADCHLGLTLPQTRFHVVDWQRSVHARRGVTCEACHGGDAQTTDLMKAHLNVLPTADPGSPMHPLRQPATCGKCHVRVLQFFQESRHMKLMASQPAAVVPTCGSCHNAAAAQLLDPDQVRARCDLCHGVGRSAAHPEYSAVARIGSLQYAATERMLDAAQEFIPLVSDPVTRASFDADEARARAALLSVAESSHSINYDTIDEKLTVAFDRVVGLVRRVINSVSPR